MGLKANDWAIFPLCVACHVEHDQGRAGGKKEWQGSEDRWISKTLGRAIQDGIFVLKR